MAGYFHESDVWVYTYKDENTKTARFLFYVATLCAQVCACVCMHVCVCVSVCVCKPEKVDQSQQGLWNIPVFLIEARFIIFRLSFSESNVTLFFNNWALRASHNPSNRRATAVPILQFSFIPPPFVFSSLPPLSPSLSVPPPLSPLISRQLWDCACELALVQQSKIRLCRKVQICHQRCENLCSDRATRMLPRIFLPASTAAFV